MVARCTASPPPLLLRLRRRASLRTSTRVVAAPPPSVAVSALRFGGGAASAAAPSRAPPLSDAVGTLRTLYPQPPLVSSGTLAVTPPHILSYSIYGTPRGCPVLCLHGGPGAACWPRHACFFDAAHYCIVLLDQRGCGGSVPSGELQHNTTRHLIDDCEALRVHLGIDRWALFGGSWGVALALAYATTHPSRVKWLVLRGICLMRRSEIHWAFRGGGAGHLRPAAWRAFLAALSVDVSRNEDPIEAAFAQLRSPDVTVRERAAGAWLRWGGAAGGAPPQSGVQRWDGSKWGVVPSADGLSGRAATAAAAAAAAGGSGQPARKAASAAAAQPAPASPHAPPPPASGAPSTAAAPPPPMSPSVVQALLEAHYCLHGGFIDALPPPGGAVAGAPPPLPPPSEEEGDGQNRPASSTDCSGLLSRLSVLRSSGVPCFAVHGRMDGLCPVSSAYDLHLAWPEAEVVVVSSAGHSQYEPGIIHELVTATDAFRALGA